MRRLLHSVVLALLSATSACQPAYADPIPREAEQYRRTLVRVAHHGLGLEAPIATLAAQVHQESRWRRDAVSPAGAQGLAQFMPATATWMAELYPQLNTTSDAACCPGRNGPAGAGPFNPGWALRAMVLYDRWLLDRIQATNRCEQWAMTLSAYNGGLGWVQRDKRLASAEGADPLAWFDSVERFNAGRSAANFAENRGYPRRILQRWEPLYAGAGWGRGVCPERWGL